MKRSNSCPHCEGGMESCMRKSKSSRSGIIIANQRGFLSLSCRILVLLVIVPAYLILLWLISRPVLAQFALQSINEESILSAVSYEPGNATYHYILGRFYHSQDNGSSLNKAVRSYRDSLRSSPLQGGCWLDLAKAYQASGATRDAGYAIERATKLLPSNPSVRWEAGVFFLINGALEQAVENLRAFILLSPDRQEEVYDLAWKIPLDSRYVLENLVPEEYHNYKRYLLYLISAGRAGESGDVWRKIRGLPVEPEVVVRYLDFLLSGHLYEDGERIWQEYLASTNSGRQSDESGMPRNGSFEYEILNGGFDWKIQEAQGVDVFIDRDIHMLGDRSLGVTFDGTANPGTVIASQLVRVLPKTDYILRANIKSDSLTTTNGVFLAVEGHDCSVISERSEMITGTVFWREVSLKFHVPPECSAVRIKIQRDKSQKLDNKISGNIWIDGITLVQR